MAANKSTDSGLSPELQTWLDKQLLSRLLPRLVYMLFGQAKPMPRNSGQTVNFRRFSSLTAATTALSEGVTPTGDTLTVTAITATPLQYGNFIQITDYVDFTSIDPILTETARLLGENAAEVMDLVVRDVLAAGTTVAYANAVASRVLVASTDKINATDLRKIVRTLQTNKAKKMSEILNASTGVGTKPVAAAYYAIIGPKTHYDLKGVTNFQPVETYGTRDGVLEIEVGAYEDIRFILSDNAKVYAGAGVGGAVDVYAMLVFARDAYGIVAPTAIETIAKPFGSGDDPLNQRASLGWKGFFTAVRLQELAMLRYEHAVTA